MLTECTGEHCLWGEFDSTPMRDPWGLGWVWLQSQELAYLRSPQVCEPRCRSCVVHFDAKEIDTGRAFATNNTPLGVASGRLSLVMY